MLDLDALSPEALRDIARNTSADPFFRKEATKKLLADKHPYADHVEMRLLAFLKVEAVLICGCVCQPDFKGRHIRALAENLFAVDFQAE